MKKKKLFTDINFRRISKRDEVQIEKRKIYRKFIATTRIHFKYHHIKLTLNDTYGANSETPSCVVRRARGEGGRGMGNEWIAVS